MEVMEVTEVEDSREVRGEKSGGTRNGAAGSGAACDAGRGAGVVLSMDHSSRPLITLALAALVGAGTAAAQAPAPQSPSVPAPHSVWFDAAALADDEVRAGVEALTLGRVTLGASIGYSHTAHPRAEYAYPLGYAYPAADGVLPPVWCDPRTSMECDYNYFGDTPRYRAWTAALTVRYYPASFSFRNGGSRMQVYAGGHAAYRWSSWDESIVYNGCPYCAYPLGGSASGGTPLPTPADSGIVMPPNPYPPIFGGPNPVRHSRGSFEPGLDVGVRLLPIGPLFVEVGGRFTLVTADDAMRRTMQGDVESRLVLAAGFAW